MTVNVTLTPRTSLRGDFTQDGKVDSKDVILGLKKVFKYVPITDYDYEVGDLDNDGQIKSKDLIILLKYVFHYIDNL